MENKMLFNGKKGNKSIVNLLLVLTAILIIVALFLVIENLFVAVLSSLIVLIIFFLIIVRVSSLYRPSPSKQIQRIKDELEKTTSKEEIDMDKMKESIMTKNEIPEVSKKDQDKIDVIASNSSKKYHKKDCRYAKNISKNQKVEGTPRELEDKGFEACKVCNPDEY